MSNFHKLMRFLRAPPCICSVRPITKASNAVSLPSDLSEALDTSEMKHRNHPGARKRKQVKLPEKLIDAANTVLETQNMTHLREAAVVIRNQLWSRHLPIENDELRARAMNIEKDLYGYTLERMSPEERDYVEEDVKERVFEKLKKRIRLWKPMKYDDFGARSYLVTQLAADYAAVHDVFHEIRHLNPAFTPASMMDFGSGLGSCFWAARSIWPKYFQEYFSIDISNEMHGLARLLATGGNANGQVKFRSFFQREFLPATDKIAFDLVVSAFSLMELPNAVQRLETVASLWGKTNGLLVLVENGTQAGHKAVAEARDFILMISKDGGQEPAQVLAPCPHDLDCPRETQALGIPCTFEARYEEPFLTQKKHPAASRYSYVVLQRPGEIAKAREWARVIRPVLRRSRHAVCRVCCKDAQLREFVFTRKKHGRHVYRLARSSEWGDQLPLDILLPDEAGTSLCGACDEDVDDTLDDVDSK
ncbi:ribosome assembly protein METTL17, mitochondrial-like isoform X1 [Dermacentor variabilis]|uniref:ribosome assembly protein METTL17, mitochondrial-like isoform X1 n=2 Tax=Dermacentor variabilis TaxID=34621 RepID=UPI003F5B4235